jgi:hypothetical protein
MTTSDQDSVDLSQVYPQVAQAGNKNPRGYSSNFAKRVLALDPQKSIGVMLGHFCIKNDISIAWVSEKLGCSRQAVYMWFLGESRPSAKKAGEVSQLLRQIANLSTAD